MIGKIFIKNLLLKTKIGDSEAERSAPQDVLINVSLWTDFAKAIETKNTEDTVDYAYIENGIIRLSEQNEFVLLENLADEIMKMCLSDERIAKVSVKVEKPGKLKSESVGVEIEQTR